jgi:hypothetical protein
MFVLDLRKSTVLHDFAIHFLFSLGDFCVLSSNLGVGTKFPWLGLVSCTFGFPHPRWRFFWSPARAFFSHKDLCVGCCRCPVFLSGFFFLRRCCLDSCCCKQIHVRRISAPAGSLRFVFLSWSSSLPTMLYLPPIHHETSKHDSPHETKVKVKLPKHPELEFKPRHVNDSSYIKLRYWLLGFSFSPLMSPLITKKHRV